MGLDQFATIVLMALSSLLGVKALPPASGDWQLDPQGWHEVGDVRELTAQSTTVPALCAQTPDAEVVFPLVVQGVHSVQQGGRNLLLTGDPTFAVVSRFYTVPTLACRQVAKGEPLVWTVRSYSRYFARIGSMPHLAASGGVIDNFFHGTVNVIAAGSLVVLALIVTLLFSGKVPRALMISVGSFYCLVSAYFLGCVAPDFGLHPSMLTAHKVADACLWAGSCFLLNALHLLQLFSRRLLNLHFGAVGAALLITFFGTTGDAVQLGTMLPFPTLFTLLFLAMASLWRLAKAHDHRRRQIFGLLSLTGFILTICNDFSVISGLREGVTLLAVGMVAISVFLAHGVNEQIVDTYAERDYLRQNLEQEVAAKTRALREQTAELETTLVTLRTTQGELIQAAKMAALGTLSAGIAHEINNSLNYVNGALTPLTSIVDRAGDFEGKAKIGKLLAVMRQGLDVTFDVIRSLRTYSGLNQANLKDHQLRSLVHSVLTMVKMRLPEKVTVEVDVAAELMVEVNAAGINQILMNLIVNACDAMPDGGTLRIAANSSVDAVEIRVSDSGHGMSEALQQRVFEPFYTTKDVGKGTGLGLHISRREAERHGGTLTVRSNVGQGSVFTLWLPRQAAGLQAEAA